VAVAESTRAHQRFEVRLGAEVSFNDNLVRGATHDVSAGGCRVESVLPIPEGERVRIDLCVVIDGAQDPDYPHLQILADVRWGAEAQNETGEDVFFTGMQFIGVSDAQAAWLEQIISRM